MTKAKANPEFLKFVFLVLYSKVAMETGKELNYLLFLYMPYLLFSILMLKWETEEVGFYIFISL